MNHRWLASILWLSAVGIVAATLRFGFVQDTPTTTRESVVLAASPREQATSAEALRGARIILDRRNPFRLATRLPSGALEGSPSAPATGPLRPTFQFQGAVGSRGRWEAVVTGLLGREGSVVVRTGDTIAGLRVSGITRDTLIMRSIDTTWRLTVKTTWP
jgi:hypothetical protein